MTTTDRITKAITDYVKLNPNCTSHDIDVFKKGLEAGIDIITEILREKGYKL